MNDDRLSILLANIYEPSSNEEKLRFMVTIAKDLTVICRQGYQWKGDHNEVDPIVGMYCNELLHQIIGYIGVMIDASEKMEGSIPENLLHNSKLFGGTKPLEYWLTQRLGEWAESKGIEI